MSPRHRRLALVAAPGLAWALLLLWVGVEFGFAATYLVERRNLYAIEAQALLPVGLVLAAMVARAAAAPDGPERRLILDTGAQLLLALAIWPAAGLAAGPMFVLLLGWNLALSRAVVWFASRRPAPLLRDLAYGAGFAPTLVAAAAAVWAGLA